MIHLSIYLIGLILIPLICLLSAVYFDNLLTSKAIKTMLIISIFWPLIPFIIAFVFGEALS